MAASVDKDVFFWRPGDGRYHIGLIVTKKTERIKLVSDNGPLLRAGGFLYGFLLPVISFVYGWVLYTVRRKKLSNG